MSKYSPDGAETEEAPALGKAAEAHEKTLSDMDEIFKIRNAVQF